MMCWTEEMYEQSFGVMTMDDMFEQLSMSEA